MSTGTATRPTTNAQLRARVKELEEQAAQGNPSPAAATDLDGNVYEYRFPIPGHATGGHAYIAVRRCHDTGRWAVTDGQAGLCPEQFWNGQVWQPIMPWVPTARVYGWGSLDGARAQVPGLLATAEAAHLAYSEARQAAARVEALAASILPEETPAVVTLHEVAVKVAEAQAEVGRRHAKPEVSVMAPPGDWLAKAQALADTPLTAPEAEAAIAAARDDVATLLAVAKGLANLAPEEPDTEQTQLIDVAELRDLTGNGETQAIPIITEPEVTPEAAPEPEFVIPPLPKTPPIICPADTTIRPSVAVRLSKARPK